MNDKVDGRSRVNWAAHRYGREKPEFDDVTDR